MVIVIRKYVAVILLISILLYYNISYSSETLKPAEITIEGSSIDPKALENAINEVADGGTIFVKYRYTEYIFNNIITDKNIKIIGLKDKYGRIPSIAWTGSENEKESPFFTLNSTGFFHVENLHFPSSQECEGKVLFQSSVPNLTMEGLSFNTTYYSFPLIIQNPLSTDSINILINNCSFSSKSPKVEFIEPVSGSITFSDCEFSTQGLMITNNGSDISIHDNVFDNTGITVEESSKGIVELYDNEFISRNARFNIYNTENVRIYHNKINSDNVFITNTDTTPLYMKENWWGSMDGPYGIDGKVSSSGLFNYDRWAINEECTVFFDSSMSPEETLQGYGRLKNCFNHGDTQVELIVGNKVVASNVTDDLGRFNIPNIDFDTEGLLVFSHEGFETVSQEVYGTKESVIADLNHTINSLDLNNDGKVDAFDTAILARNFGNSEESPSFNREWDLNRNGKIDLLDLIIIIRFKGEFR